MFYLVALLLTLETDVCSQTQGNDVQSFTLAAQQACAKVLAALCLLVMAAIVLDHLLMLASVNAYMHVYISARASRRRWFIGVCARLPA